MKYNRPWSIQIELTEGCNRRCSFCGIHSIYREKSDVGYKFMSVDTAREIAKDLASWLPKIRIEFALQGEPLLNKNYMEIFRIFRAEFPKCQIMVTTNTDPLRKGTGFNLEKIKSLFLNGVNILVCDYYGEKQDMPYHQFKSELKKNQMFPVYDFFEDKPMIWGYKSPKIAYLVCIDNTMDRNFSRNLNNQAGNTSPDLIALDNYSIEPLPLKTRCHLPFREMAIRQDGVVPICCMDWQRETLMGKFPEKSLQDIWEGEVFFRTRSVLFNKERGAINPCNRCNYHPVKVGLVQDPYPEGHPPIKESAQIIKKSQIKKLQNKYANQPYDYKNVIK